MGAVRPEAVVLVRERLAAARGRLQEAVHALDEAGVLDEDDRLTLRALGDDLDRASAAIVEAREQLLDLRFFLRGGYVVMGGT